LSEKVEHRSISRALEGKLKDAWEISRAVFGEEITFYLPGMFRYNGISGRYPAISITGQHCELMCEHCRGSLLRTMPDVSDPAKLTAMCLAFKDAGHHGVLISGGCDRNGRLPWGRFVEAMARVKEETGLYMTVHCGIVNRKEAKLLKEAGVDQALLDVIGDDETYRRIYHADLGVSDILGSMDALRGAGIEIVPHVVCGLFFGRMRSEREALRIIAPFEVTQVVIVSLMPPGGAGFSSPSAAEVAEIIAEARLMMPEVRLALGCARKRGNYDMEGLALRAGVNRMAIPSEETVATALALGLKPRYQRSCCSVSMDRSSEKW
jgi:uncharacterized radical SAM superfamily protein